MILIFVGINIGCSIENDNFSDIWIQGFDTCLLLIKFFSLVRFMKIGIQSMISQ